MQTPPIMSAEEWKGASERFLAKENAHSKAHDALVAERRRMPWMEIPATDPIPCLLRARRRPMAGTGLRRLPLDRRSGCPPRPSERARDKSLAFVSRAPQPDAELTAKSATACSGRGRLLQSLG
ncbi:DUF899 family protein [Sphingopyxis panaciterrae]